MHRCYVYIGVSFNKYIHLCSHHPQQCVGHFHSLESLPGSFSVSPSGPPCKIPLFWFLASECRFACYGTSCKTCALLSWRFSHLWESASHCFLFLIGVFLSGSTTVCLHSPAVNHLGQIHLAIITKAAVNMLSFLLGKYLGLQLLWETAKLFSKWLCHFILTSSVWDP